MLHAKVMTVDGLLANIGSANLNVRSVARDEEGVNLVVLDRAVTATLDQHFEEDLERSVRVEPRRWRRRPLPRRLAEAALAPLRPQTRSPSDDGGGIPQ